MASLSEASKTKVAGLYCAPPFPTVPQLAKLVKLSPNTIYRAGHEDREWWQGVKAERERVQAAWIAEKVAQAEADMTGLLDLAIDSLKVHLSDGFVYRFPLAAAEARRQVFKYLLGEPTKKLDLTTAGRAFTITIDREGRE